MGVLTRKPTAERREEIAGAALKIIGERGVTSLTTSVLAEEVGVTSGALFRHFASLNEILCEAARHGVAKIEETFPVDGLPPLDRLMELARARIHLLSSQPGIAWLLRSEQARLILPEEAVRLLVGLVTRSKQFIIEALREAGADGSIRNDVEPEVLLAVFTGTVHALIGARGVHRLATGELERGPESVLSGFVRLVTPPETLDLNPLETTRPKESWT